MILRLFPCFLLICILSFMTSCSKDSEPVFKEYRSVYKIGDQQQWAGKSWNDDNWIKRRMAYVADGKVFWSRTPIDILKAPESTQPYGLRLEAYGEYEIFWDGVLIGKNGNPGQEAHLPPEGKLWTTFSLPKHLTNKGRHLLALRLSNYYFPDHVGSYKIEIADYEELVTDRLFETSYTHIFAGAFLMAALYFLFLFFSNKKEYPILIVSASCFLFFTLTMTRFVRMAAPIHYKWHVLRLEVISSLMFVISFLIPLFLSLQFPFPKRKLFLSIYAGILLYFFIANHHYFGFSIYRMVVALWFFSLGIALFGAFKRAKGALLMVLILLLCLGLQNTVSLSISLYVGFSLMLLGILYLVFLRTKAQRLAYDNSLVQSTRLRLELLKKNIQPHFLMNTLTSLIDWIEESPKKGVRFIEALAKEFDLFNRIESKTLIPIAQEIEICRNHMEIMGFRKEVNYFWEEEGLDIEDEIPPGILHTLLENGITHSIAGDDNSIRFKLVYHANTNFRSYTFLTFAADSRPSPVARAEGTGLKYIKARLKESYQDRWDFSSEPTSEGWKSTIKIYF